LAPFGANFFI